jgi:CheY-like chemotaxis protein
MRPTSTADGHRAPGTVPSVLVVEDEQDVRFLLRAILTSSGRFEVVGEAAEGAAALELVAREQVNPDIILLDLLMPGMDGRTALPLLLDACPRAMVVVLSALDATVQQQASLDLGAFAYLEKSTIGPRLPLLLGDLHHRFLPALAGDTVAAPGPLGHGAAT